MRRPPSLLDCQLRLGLATTFAERAGSGCERTRECSSGGCAEYERMRESHDCEPIRAEGSMRVCSSACVGVSAGRVEGWMRSIDAQDDRQHGARSLFELHPRCDESGSRSTDRSDCTAIAGRTAHPAARPRTLLSVLLSAVDA